MTHDPTAPITTAPPRQVFKRMRVMGHDVRKPSGTVSGPTMYCSCGWQSTTVDVDAAEAEAGEHQATAWPVLVPHPGGPMLAWLAEVEAKWMQASQELAATAAQREERSALEDRVNVLHHQLDDLHFRHYGWEHPHAPS